MPEGDTVWRTARRLHQALSGPPLVVSDFRVPRWAEINLTGRSIIETVSRGKHLLTRLDDVTVHTHLMMDGSWRVFRPGSPWSAPGHQARLVLATAEWQAVGFRLGLVEVLERSREHDAVGHLGPDLLGDDWSVPEAVRRLTADPLRPISEALLDQRNLAGIGNLYAVELCFLSGLHPQSPTGHADLVAVVERAQRLLSANRERVEQATTGDLRRGRTHYVYRRAGQPCLRCGTRVLTQTFPISAAHRRAPGGALEEDRARVSFWCPACQPLREEQG